MTEQPTFAEEVAAALDDEEPWLVTEMLVGLLSEWLATGGSDDLAARTRSALRIPS